MRRSLRFYPEWETYIFKWKENVTQVCLNGLSHVCNTNYNKQALFTWKEKENVISPFCKNAIASIAFNTKKHCLDTHMKTGKTLLWRPPFLLQIVWHFCELSMSLWTVCFAPRQTYSTSPKWTIMCSPTHSIQQEKNYIFQVSAAKWWKYIGGKGMYRNTVSTESSPETCHQSAFHRNNIVKSAITDFWPLCFVFGGSSLFVRSLIPAACLSFALSFTFSWKHNAAALIIALIGRYTSILS